MPDEVSQEMVAVDLPRRVLVEEALRISKLRAGETSR